MPSQTAPEIQECEKLEHDLKKSLEICSPAARPKLKRMLAGVRSDLRASVVKEYDRQYQLVESLQVSLEDHTAELKRLAALRDELAPRTKKEAV